MRQAAIALTTPYHGRIKNFAVAALAFDRHFDVEGDQGSASSRPRATPAFDRDRFGVEMRHYGRTGAGVIWARKR